MNEITMHIAHGRIENSQPVKQFFSDLPDGSYSVRFTPRKIRSLPQNAYYHAIMVPMVKEGLRGAGYDEVKTNNDAHEVLKVLFLKREIVNKETGQLITTIPGSSADLSTVEFKDYMERIAQWAAEFLGVYIPPPGMQLKFQ